MSGDTDSGEQFREAADMTEPELDVYDLRKRGFRVLDADQCCDLACSGGACEGCPCCVAGWCVWGRDALPDPVTDADNYAIWLDEARLHNPVAERLAQLEERAEGC